MYQNLIELKERCEQNAAKFKGVRNGCFLYAFYMNAAHEYERRIEKLTIEDCEK